MKLRQPYQPSFARELGSFRPKVDSPDDVSPELKSTRPMKQDANALQNEQDFTCTVPVFTLDPFSRFKERKYQRVNRLKSVRTDLGQNDPIQFRQVETVLSSLLEFKSMSMLIHKVCFGYSTKVAYNVRTESSTSRELINCTFRHTVGEHARKLSKQYGGPSVTNV